LLNKHDYSFQPAVPVLERIRSLEIPLILASSKTEEEMRVLAEEMELKDAPIICENGGAIVWSRSADDRSVLGAERSEILRVLKELKSQFNFASFADLKLDGIMQATDLPAERAQAALKRASTEPLLWQDAEEKLPAFSGCLKSSGLTLTRGGRFWHVAGQTSKGKAMQRVVQQYQQQAEQSIETVAIGDSPIDQSMLDIADYPIGIPWPDGVVHVEISRHNGVVAANDGAAGWASAVSGVIEKICASAS
jgi:mannosyl-3-phosphoglycerate phosphatase